MRKHDHTPGPQEREGTTPGRTLSDNGKQGASTFQYTYSPSFGKEDSTGAQDETDKRVLKRLSQVYKENVLTKQQLQKRLHQELQRSMDLDKPRKDTLSENLHKTLLYPGRESYTDYRQAHIHHTREGIQALRTHTYPLREPGRESLKIGSTPYSHIPSKVQSSLYTLTIKTTQYIEQCTLTPECLDCTKNHSYSQCGARKPIKHTTYHTVPFSQFWFYALHVTP